MLKKILILILALAVAVSTIACVKNDNATSQNSNIETPDVENNENKEIQYSEEDMELVNGIPNYLFNKTEKEFPLTLKNKVTGQFFDITLTSKYTDFFEYVPLAEMTPNVYIPDELPLNKGETSLYVNVVDKNNSEFGVFVFGAVNETEELIYFKDARTIYISYYGMPDWELCGISTAMSTQEVKSKIGEPAQNMMADSGLIFEYYMLKESHTYSLLIMFDDNECVAKIALNIDNYPVYANQTITE